MEGDGRDSTVQQTDQMVREFYKSVPVSIVDVIYALDMYDI